MLLLGQLAIVNIFLGHEWKEVNYYVMEFVETGYNWATILSKHRADIWLGKFHRGLSGICHDAADHHVQPVRRGSAPPFSG